jgi:peptide methionine sulfoxide reductase MsrB
MNKPMPENEEQIKEMLTPEEYAILREKGTEAPFSSEFVHKKDSDIIYLYFHIFHLPSKNIL